MDTEGLSLTFDGISNKKLDFNLSSYVDRDKSNALTHSILYLIAENEIAEHSDHLNLHENA
jgi:hypothetical protein